jgi:hypothetical protein
MLEPWINRYETLITMFETLKIMLGSRIDRFQTWIDRFQRRHPRFSACRQQQPRAARNEGPPHDQVTEGDYFWGAGVATWHICIP